MYSRATRMLIAVFFVTFLAVAASAAPESRSDSGDWISRQIHHIVYQLKKIFAPSPSDDPLLIPPHP